jgi:hypothetical protein
MSAVPTLRFVLLVIVFGLSLLMVGCGTIGSLNKYELLLQKTANQPNNFPILVYPGAICREVEGQPVPDSNGATPSTAVSTQPLVVIFTTPDPVYKVSDYYYSYFVRAGWSVTKPTKELGNTLICWSTSNKKWLAEMNLNQCTNGTIIKITMHGFDQRIPQVQSFTHH